MSDFNPFATSTPRPAPVDQTLVAEANARDYTDSLFEFPEFEMEVPEITRTSGRGNGSPALPKDPEQRALVEALISFVPGSNQAKFVGFTRTGDTAIDEKTKTLATNVSLRARKHGIKVITRTMVHPHDLAKPKHEQRYVMAMWRGVMEAAK